MRNLGPFVLALALGVAGSVAACGDSSPPAGTSGASSAGVGGTGLGGTGGGSVGGNASGGAGQSGAGRGGAAGSMSSGGASSGGSAGAGTGGIAGASGGASAGESSSGGTGQSGSGGLGGAAGTMAGNAGAGNGGVAGSTSGGAGLGGQGTSGAGGAGGAESKNLLFLLLGQSNMEGYPQPQAEDREQDPRIKVLAYEDCSAVNREYGQWYTAIPPLHSCGGGVGPGDYFAKTLIESLPSDYTIGLIPCAVNGAPIDLFRKGVPRTSHELPPDNHWETGYEWIISRAQEAQKTGVIRGILFHQGESNFGQSDWVTKVQDLVSDLKADLGLGDVPFLAGELYYDGCCQSHNTLVAELAASVPNGHVISASGLDGVDQYHFDLPAQRVFGTRYGEKMQEVLTLP